MCESTLENGIYYKYVIEHKIQNTTNSNRKYVERGNIDIITHIHDRSL